MTTTTTTTDNRIKETQDMPRETTLKPKKPYAEYPLTAHANRQWCKKIKGKVHFFGVWADPDAALAKYLDERDDLQAGRIPRRLSSVVVNVGSLVNLFLDQRNAKVESGSLSPQMFVDYRNCAKFLIEHLGRSTAVETLRPADFIGLRDLWAGKYASGRLNKLVQMTRTIFKWGWETDLLKVQVKLGPDFKGATKRQAREQRNARGLKLFEASELQTLLKAASTSMKAMILLAVNCGYGNTDIATLRDSNIKAGWLDFPRPKTAVPRRAPLWPETESAIADVIQRRPKAANESDAGLVFLTKHGSAWIRSTVSHTDDGIAKAFRKLLGTTALYQRGRAFYGLRHTFATIGDEARDAVALASLMGHSDASMAGHYRERIEDARLRAVVDHVHEWLFGTEGASMTTPAPAGPGAEVPLVETTLTTKPKPSRKGKVQP